MKSKTDTCPRAPASDPADPLGAALERALADEPDEQLRELIGRLLAAPSEDPPTSAPTGKLRKGRAEK